LSGAGRTLTGKKVKTLRRQGRTPAVVYGTVVPDPVSITLDTRELDRTYHAYGSTTLVDVSVDGTTYTVYIRNLQQEVLSRAPIHAELFAPNLLVALDVSVPVIMVGELAAITDGALMQLRETLDLRGRPTDIPSAIEVDVTEMKEVDDSITVGQLRIPADVELLTDPDEQVVRVIATRAMLEEVEEEEAAAAEEAAAEAEAEGEAAEGEAEPAEEPSE
jgi:large subunit ribosomal protein L25